MPRPFSFLLRLTTCFATLAISTNLPAAIIAQQRYDGNLLVFDDNLNEGSPAVAGLTYSTLNVAGGARTFGNYPSTSFTNAPAPGGIPGGSLPKTATYYVSWLMNTAVSTNADFGMRASFFHDGNGGGTDTYIGAYGQNGGKISFYAGLYGPPQPVSNTVIQSAINATTGTHMYVVKITTDQAANVSTFSLYYDPTSSVEALNTPVAGLNYSTAAFRLERLQPNNLATWDEFRVADNFSDVTAGLAVPEPGTLTLLGLGLGAAFLRTRRRTS